MSESRGAVSLLSYETLVHAVAGAMGSVTAMSVFFPLDTARIRLQAWCGWKVLLMCTQTRRVSTATPCKPCKLSLYRGWFPVISSLCCSNFVYFYTFNTLKRVMVTEQSKPGTDLLMGCISGAVNVLLTTPMWVVNTRLKLQGAKFRNEELHQTHYKGILDAFTQIVSREGVWRLWDGTLPSLLLVFNPSLQFAVYEAMKRRAARVDRRISSFEIFIFGAIAKAIATTATYPLQTVQAILRFGQYKSEGNAGLLGSLRNLLALLMDRIKRQGPLGLYKGLEAKLLQTVLTAALMFVVYEKITHATFKLMRLQRKLKH